MIPLVDKPGIQYVVEEAVAAGIEDILIVTGRSKKTIEDHFDRAPELEARLERRGKERGLAEVRAISRAGRHPLRAPGRGPGAGPRRGHGPLPRRRRAVRRAAAATTSWPRARPLLGDMIAACERTGGSVIALKEFGPDGDLRVRRRRAGRARPAGAAWGSGMVEKPPPPTRQRPRHHGPLRAHARPIFDADRRAPARRRRRAAADRRHARPAAGASPVYGLVFDGGRYDTGNKLDWLRATVEVALQHEELGKGFRDILAEIVRREGIG